MKYHLVLGYYLFEKYKKNPTCRISINNQLITDFECDNTKTIEVEYSTKDLRRFDSSDGNPYVNVRSRSQSHSFSMPAKAKVIEMDLTEQHRDSTLCVEILDNPTNYTNGFMTKRNLVSFRPIYLIPESLIKNKVRLKKFIMKSFEITQDVVKNRRLGYRDKWCWPGFHDEFIPPYLGGTQKLYFTIKKKQNFYFLASDKTKFPSFQPTKNPNHVPVYYGFPQIEDFFYAWLNHYTKTNRKIVYDNWVNANKGTLKHKLDIDIIEKPINKKNK